MPRARKRISAKRDLTVLFAYFGERAGLDLADRFIQAVQDSFEELARFPELGSPGKVHRGKYQGVRLWAVRGFPKYLIAYRPSSDGIVVERVFHAAQDYRRVLT
jgi:toxin ParE1/3/4